MQETQLGLGSLHPKLYAAHKWSCPDHLDAYFALQVWGCESEWINVLRDFVQKKIKSPSSSIRSWTEFSYTIFQHMEAHCHPLSSALGATAEASNAQTQPRIEANPSGRQGHLQRLTGMVVSQYPRWSHWLLFWMPGFLVATGRVCFCSVNYI